MQTMNALDTFLLRACDAAKAAGHIWPEYAACEVAVETSWGRSESCVQYNNLFGQKQHVHPIYGTVTLPTNEYLHGALTRISDDFIVFPDWASSLRDRMDTLRRLAPAYPHYAAALEATDGETFVREVSLSWSTDPHRADTVLAIHRAHFPAQPADQVQA